MAMDVHEIGSSGGLNLLFDSFAYDFGGARLGPMEIRRCISRPRSEAPPPRSTEGW